MILHRSSHRLLAWSSLCLTLAIACGKEGGASGGDGDGDLLGDGDGDLPGDGDGDLPGDGDGDLPGDGDGDLPGDGDGDLPGTGGTNGSGGSLMGGDTGLGGDPVQPPDCDPPEVAEGSSCRAVRVLVLSDIDGAVAGDENSVTTALANFGFEVTTGPDFADWDGLSPGLGEVDVVLLLGGEDYSQQLTPTAHANLSAFVAQGGGLIFTEWTAYQGDPALDMGLLPVVYDGDYDYGAEWVVDIDNHPLARDIQNPDLGIGGAGNYTSQAGWSYVAPLEGSVVVISNTEGYPVATYSTCHGGTTIHLNHDVHYTTDPVDEGDLILFRNATYYAALPDQTGGECAMGGASSN